MNAVLLEKLEQQCPAELFVDQKGVITRHEQTLRIARYATLQQVARMTEFTEKRVVDIAKGEYSGSFMAETQRARTGKHKDIGGMTAGDIELAAIEAGEGTYEVYETLWPFCPEEAKKTLLETSVA